MGRLVCDAPRPHPVRVCNHCYRRPICVLTYSGRGKAQSVYNSLRIPMPGVRAVTLMTRDCPLQPVVIGFLPSSFSRSPMAFCHCSWSIYQRYTSCSWSDVQRRMRAFMSLRRPALEAALLGPLLSSISFLCFFILTRQSASSLHIFLQTTCYSLRFFTVSCV